MKIPVVLFFLILFFGLTSHPVKAQNDLQCRINILNPGKTTLPELKMLFGEPDSQTKGVSWFEVFDNSDTGKKNYYLVGSKAAEEYSNKKLRTFYDFNYPKQGLVFTFFDNPFELHEIEITNPEISVSGIKIGDKLGKVKRVLGKNGEWFTTDSRDNWTLDYEKSGIDFLFDRDKNAPKFPMKLDKRKRVIKIEIYDSKTSFLG